MVFSRFTPSAIRHSPVVFVDGARWVMGRLVESLPGWEGRL
ncbi:MAG: hypothetical protein ABIG63_04650 [Chloroflexota bacterium]